MIVKLSIRKLGSSSALLNITRIDEDPRLRIESFAIITYVYLLSFVETPRKFIIAELSIRKLGSSSVL